MVKPENVKGKRLKKTAKELFVRGTGIEPYRLFARKENLLNNLEALIQFRRPIFHWLTIETSTYCNRKCHACPVSTSPRNKLYMPENMFMKIVGDLVRMKFTGIIHLHLFNEPLADKTIFEKVKILSNKLPMAQIKMNSNGDFLTNKLLSKLALAGLDELYITQYDGEVTKRTLEVLAKASDAEKDVLTVRVKSNFVGNRAGLLNNVVVEEPILADCNRPSHQLIINCSGDIVICCNDYFGKVVFGNVTENGLLDIWRSEQFESIRRLLRMRKRNKIELCKSCNFFGDIYGCRDLTSGQINAFNKIVRQRNTMNRIVPHLLMNSLDRLRMHKLLT
jgi:GTP 3',8-cyclase